MKGLSIFLLPVLALANPIPNQWGWGQGAAPAKWQDSVTAQTITSDIHGIDNSVYKLRQDLQNYNGHGLSGWAIVEDFNNLQFANRQAYNDCKMRWNNFTAADSTTIVQYTIKSIGNDIPAAMTELKAKQGQFQSAGQQESVATTLKILLSDHNSFMAALSDKLTSSQSGMVAVAQTISNAMQSGVSAFGG